MTATLKSHLSALGRPLRVVVTGGRTFADAGAVGFALGGLLRAYGIERLAQGGAAGADRLAAEWAKANGVTFETHKADWSLGKRGGPQRNRRMLDAEKPDIVVAFPGHDGTRDCIAAAKERGLAVWCVGWTP